MICMHVDATPVSAKVRTDRTIYTTWTCGSCGIEINYVMNSEDVKLARNPYVKMRTYVKQERAKEAQEDREYRDKIAKFFAEYNDDEFQGAYDGDEI